LLGSIVPGDLAEPSPQSIVAEVALEHDGEASTTPENGTPAPAWTESPLASAAGAPINPNPSTTAANAAVRRIAHPNEKPTVRYPH
jgi:hypothetical protein